MQWLFETVRCRVRCDARAQEIRSVAALRHRRGESSQWLVKILLWDRDGFLLWYKRLESGVFKLPRVQEGSGSMELRASELAMVLDGIDVSKLKRVPRYTRISSENKEKILV